MELNDEKDYLHYSAALTGSLSKYELGDNLQDYLHYSAALTYLRELGELPRYQDYLHYSAALTR